MFTCAYWDVIKIMEQYIKNTNSDWWDVDNNGMCFSFSHMADGVAPSPPLATLFKYQYWRSKFVLSWHYNVSIWHSVMVFFFLVTMMKISWINSDVWLEIERNHLRSLYVIFYMNWNGIVYQTLVNLVEVKYCCIFWSLRTPIFFYVGITSQEKDIVWSDIAQISIINPFEKFGFYYGLMFLE